MNEDVRTALDAAARERDRIEKSVRKLVQIVGEGSVFGFELKKLTLLQEKIYVHCGMLPA